MRADSPTQHRATVAAITLSVALLLGACSSTGGSTPATSPGTAAAAASGAARVEVNPAGDIPDNQAFVAYAGTGFSVTTPEGWARSNAGSAVVFSDKYNSITITKGAAAQAPSVASAQAHDVPAIKATSHGFVPGAISTVKRKAGTAILITYHALSQVNPVTGKVANEAVERYTFWQSGTSVTLTLAAPVGSDNVDPWRKVTDSFTWTK
ncbi:MAG: hypothetical protein ABI345_02265 [Jatrophihabitans sp.]